MEDEMQRALLVSMVIFCLHGCLSRADTNETDATGAVVNLESVQRYAKALERRIDAQDRLICTVLRTITGPEAEAVRKAACP